MKIKRVTVVLILILAVAFSLRFTKLEEIPPGLHGDGASQGYNAYSLLNTGKDRYGQAFPILFRSLGSYQPPLYTYLTTIPVAVFGNTVFAANFVSAVSGVLLSLVSYIFIVVLFKNQKQKEKLALIFAFIITISPWSVLFSRLAVEANLAVTIFALSILLFIYSLKNTKIFPLACLVLGISTHAYYSERLIALTFLPIFVIIFRKTFISHKKLLVTGLGAFFITQIPHLMILNSGALGRRFDQVGISEKDILTVILNNYLIYFSPKNLFFDSDTGIGRTMPGLSVFYGIFIIPFFAGLHYILKNISKTLSKIISILLMLTPLPAAFTGDFFYPLRTLDFLWVTTLVISLGLWQIYNLFRDGFSKYFVSACLIAYCLFSLYISYFILFKYEKGKDYGYAYIKLVEKLKDYKDKSIIIDLARDPGVGVRMAYLLNYSPQKVQKQLATQLNSPYYSSKVNLEELFTIDNIEVKPLSFGDACRENVVMIGDKLSISDEQVKAHNLKPEFEIKDISGKASLVGYITNPPKTCYPD